MLKTIWAFLTGGKVVWLQDHDGELTRTIAYKVGFGKMQARRMMFIEKVILNEDGTVSGKSFVHYWSYE